MGRLLVLQRGLWRTLETGRRILTLPTMEAPGQSLRGERPAGDLGQRHEVSGLEEGFKDMLRSCLSLDKLADKPAFL